MADVRCPLCGKQNPAENETCQFCQARLKPLRIKPETGPGASLPGQTVPGVPADKAPDEFGGWLNSLRSSGASTPDPQEEDLPDWLRSESQTEDEDQPFNDAQGGLPDWLAGTSETVPWDAKTGGEESQGASPVQAGKPFQDDGLQDVFGEQKARQDAFDSPEDLPDWLFEKASPAEVESDSTQWSKWEEEAGGASELARDLPDWLAGSSLPESTEKGDSGLPDWLILKDQGEALSEPGTPEQADAVSGRAGGQNTEEWWPSLAASEEGSSTSGPGSEWPAAESQEAGFPFEIGENETALPAEPGGFLPVQLQGPEAGEAVQAGSDADLPPWLFSPDEPAQEASLPEWISGLEAGAEETATEEGLPGWLNGAEVIGAVAAAGALQAESAETEELFREADLPDWLRGDEPLSEELPASPGAPEGDQDLSMAELPPWLASIRTVAAVELINVAADTDAAVEDIGPLRGFKGILPVEPDIARGHRMAPTTTKTKTPELQGEHAALFAELIRTEGQSQSVEKKASASGRSILRGLVGLVLVVAVLIPLLVHYPQYKPPEVEQAAAAVNQLVSAIPTGLPVLVAVDYPASAEGEMDIAARPVIKQLLGRGAFLALVSTNPTGPAQAEYLVSLSASPDQVAQQTINLGYIPGGPPGLLGFAETPQQVMPNALDGRYAWELPQLSQIISMGNFGMLIVITDNPDSSRAWIEQVRPLMGLVPMVFITSAQIEPIVQPYFGVYPMPVQGIVSGVPGGTAYESLISENDPYSTKYWPSFSLGGLVAVILILVGGLLSNAVPSNDVKGTPNGREKKPA